MSKVEGPLSTRDIVAEWETIVSKLGSAVRRDPKRRLIDLMGLALREEMAFWRVSDGSEGYIVTQMTRKAKSFKRTFWIIYAGGMSGGMDAMRNLMAGFEHLALANDCDEMRFEGRDWRKILPDYRAQKGSDGRWVFRKELA